MRASRKWLSNYVKIRLSDESLSDKLTMTGLEVESVESPGETLRGIIVGEVRKVERHPNADRLTVCVVFDGVKELSVVCGAPNVRTGQKVAFAPLGTTILRNQHDPDGAPFHLKSVKIRGVVSSGMICSGFELGVSDDREGILVFDHTARPGRSISKELGLDDSIYEIGVTANRPDLLSHIGIAREISAVLGKKLILPRTVITEGNPTVKSALSVRIDAPALCPRYSARVIFDVNVRESPEWLRKALSAVGIRPINNIVDVTNYVLMEYGHPLHAFDYERIKGREIIVRTPREETTFITLDGKSRKLDADTLLICDSDDPVAIGGVMGGENSEISDGTMKIVIESAYFHPASIRRTSKRLGVSTDASQRFERGADPNATLQALDRAAALIREVAGGTILKGRIDKYPRKIKAKVVPFSIENSNKLLDITLDNLEVTRLLGRIGIMKKSSPSKEKIHFLVPTWRPDITREIDLIEEVARLYGYDRIKTAERAHLSLGSKPPMTDISDNIRSFLSSSGYHEIVTNSMQDDNTAEALGDNYVTISNPISRDMATLRTHLLPGLLTTIKHNIFHGTDSSRFYEIGSVFSKEPHGDPERLETYRESERLIIGLYGMVFPTFWGTKEEKVDIFTLKGEANALFHKISLDNPTYIPYPNPTALTERSIHIEINGQNLGLIGKVSKQLLKRYDLDDDVFFLELSVDEIRKYRSDNTKYQPFSRYPAVNRDLALIISDSIPAGDIERTIREAAGPLLTNVTLFDIYRGEQAGEGKKSCAFSLEFVSPDRTLGQEEIQRMMEKVTEKLENSYQAVLRQ